MLDCNYWSTNAAQERRTVMKKLKKLRIGKETLLPLESRQMREVAAGISVSDVLHFPGSQFSHIISVFSDAC